MYGSLHVERNVEILKMIKMDEGEQINLWFYTRCSKNGTIAMLYLRSDLFYDTGFQRGI